MSNALYRLAMLGASLLIAGCGGDSSSLGSSATTSGAVVGSYFRNAVVCLDANNNGACDSGEPSTRSDANGQFTLAGTGAVVAEIGTDAIQFEPSTSTTTPVTSRIVLRAPKEAPGIVNTHSTAVVAEMESGSSFSDALKNVAASVGVSTDKLLTDFNKETDATTKTALKKGSDDALQRIQQALASAKSADDVKKILSGATGSLHAIKTIVVVYAENRSFDNLYGLFPGANGIASALQDPKLYQQVDRDGTTVLASLPPVWNASPGAQATAWAFVRGLPNKPFQIDGAPGGAPTGQNVASPDLVHRFYNDQMQINGGKNNMYVAWSDAGGLAMGYYDGSTMAMWPIAKQYTLADNFFMGAFGGSFLNHFWLVCACTPPFNNAPASRITQVDLSKTPPQLTLAPSNPASALSGKPVFAGDLNVTPKLADGNLYAINTTQPPYQPSGVAPAVGGNTSIADPAATGGSATLTVDSSKVKTIGDMLTAKGLDWKWYAGAWNDALADGAKQPASRNVIYNNTVPNFQAHHHPFNYFTRFDPTTTAGAAERAAHLKDYNDLLADITGGTLPPVTFYKPQGNLNQHPGYTDVMQGDAHIAELISKLQAGPQWHNMVIVVTYDENGGFFDHVAPPKADQWGPGTRIPAVVISPFAKKGYVDSTPYDTTSILKLITRRFALEPLPGLNRTAISDLSNSLDMSQK